MTAPLPSHRGWLRLVIGHQDNGGHFGTRIKQREV